MSAGGAPGRREVAYRLFAAEFDDADFSYSESDEERAPNYVVTPTGARVNRLFLVGVLTETERVNEDMVRARIVDPTGAFVVYAGQYQPDELAFLERVDPPTFLAVTGKARTFQPEDSDRVFTSVRPESISEVDAGTRDRWVVQAAERTVERVETMAAAIDSGLSDDALRETLESDGVDPSLAAGIPIALDHYGTTPDYLAGLRDLAEDALATVVGEVDEVGSFDLAPSEGAGDAAALADASVAAADTGEPGDATAAAGTGGSAAGSATGSSPSEVTPGTAEVEITDDGGAAQSQTDAGTAEAGTADAVEADATAADGMAADAATPDEATIEADPDAADEDELGDFDPAEDDALSDAERREVEAEYGTDFATGNEVDDPAEPDAEPSDVEPSPSETEGRDENAADVDEGGAVESGRTDAESAEPASAEAQYTDAEEVELTDAEGEKAPSADRAATDHAPSDHDADEVPLDEAVMDAMRELDDGDGADRDAIVAAVTDRTGATADEVEDAIQDALMSGQCYEPDDGVFKPI